jgi:hypothetical protein
MVMSAFAPSSFAGLTSSLVVWLLSGGSLALLCSSSRSTSIVAIR